MSLKLKPEAIDVDTDLVVSILSPYKEGCRYLKKMSVLCNANGEDFDDHNPHTPSGVVTAEGKFSVPESCYIDNTGHFNSVEFHICYNQFIYVLLAHCVEHKLLPPMKDMNLEEYKRRQLPDILLADFSTSFKRPIKDSNSFQGRLTINRVTARKKTIFIKTHCSFFDDHNGFSEGDMLLAIIDNSQNGNLGRN